MSSYQNKIKVNQVRKEFENKLVLEDVSFYIEDGEFVSIVGPSGSGKSTILNLLAGLIKPDVGDIIVDGQVSYMYQKDMLVPWKKVIDNIGLPYVFQGYKKKQAREKVYPYLEEFGLLDCKEQYPNQLSGGMKQRANFLKTFLTSRDIMLLDEPFGALDALTKRNMQKWLMKIQKKYHATILLITHDIEEALLLSDRVYVLSGKPATIVTGFSVKKIKSDEEDVVTSDAFLESKRQILHLLYKE